MNYVSKRFLSETDGDETGSIICKAKAGDYDDLHRYSAEHPTVDASISIRDCYGKPVELEFSVSENYTVADRQAKVDVLIGELVAFKEALPKLYDSALSEAARWLEDHPEEDDGLRVMVRDMPIIDDILGRS